MNSMQQCSIVFVNRQSYCQFKISHLIRRFINQQKNESKYPDESKLMETDKVSVVAHPDSKLKLFSYAIPVDETEYERKLREKKLKIQNRNHQYWCEINASFNRQKKDFIQNELKNRLPDVDFTSPQTHEELAQFYKKFLDENHSKYIDYNFEWYRNNLSLLWPSFVVSLIRLKRRFNPVKRISSNLKK